MIINILKNQFKLLSFQSLRIKNHKEFWGYFIYILIITWLVGIGRYWDHPKADWWQYAGLGSLAYIFFLSIFLYVILFPLKPQNFSYKIILLFVGLTSLPALLYAIPVERFLTMSQAQTANVLFLAIVAIWRVALYLKFLISVLKLNWFSIIVTTLLPLSAIVFVLGLLNLEHVVFQLMAGIRESEISANDQAYQVDFILMYFSYIAFPVTVISYIVAVIINFKKAKI